MKPPFPTDTTGTTDCRSLVGRPFRTDGCLLLLCEEGTAVVSANLQRMLFRKGDLCLLTSDVRFSLVKRSALFSVRWIMFSEEVCTSAFCKVSNMAFWDFLHFVPVLNLSADRYRLVSEWFRQTGWVIGEGTEMHRFTLLCNQIHQLLMALDGELAGRSPASVFVRRDRGWTLLCRFFALLSEHAVREHEVRFYADTLCITPDYLRKICRRLYGVPPKELIDQTLVAEIRTRLIGTELPIRTIARQLRFEDASYMCRFFRRRTGVSPLAFRSGADAQSGGRSGADEKNTICI